MRRSLHVAFAWRRTFWLRMGPGKWTGIGLLLTPAAFLLPLSELPFVSDREASVGLVLWVAALVLAFRTRGSDPVRDDSLIWLYQKGLSPADMALANLLLDLVMALGFAACWALAGTVFLTPSLAEVPTLFAALLARGFATFVTAYLVLFSLGALGVRSPTDVTAGLLLLSLLTPSLAVVSSGGVLPMLRWVIPPFLAPVGLSVSISTGNAVGIAEASLHLAAYATALVALGFHQMSRWRPKA